MLRQRKRVRSAVFLEWLWQEKLLRPSILRSWKVLHFLGFQTHTRFEMHCYLGKYSTMRINERYAPPLWVCYSTGLALKCWKVLAKRAEEKRKKEEEVYQSSENVIKRKQRESVCRFFVYNAKERAYNSSQSLS